jgi:hypothetical protein
MTVCHSAVSSPVPPNGGYLQLTRLRLVVELLGLDGGIWLLAKAHLGWTGVYRFLAGGYPKAYRQKTLKKLLRVG